MKSLPKLIAGVVLAVALGAGAYLTFAPAPTAPNVQFATLNGEKLSTVDLRGKVVLVNFWATTCVTCVKEMPALIDTYNKFRDKGFDTVAVAMSYDPPNYVLNFAQSRALPFKVALDLQGEVARGFGDVKLTPTTFILDKRGQIVKRYLGEPNFAELHALLERKLAEPG